jgi:hypothetical protein
VKRLPNDYTFSISRARKMIWCVALRMSESGQKRKSGPAILTSVLPSTADIRERGGHVRKVPTADVIKEAANCGGLTFSKAVSGLC